MEEFIDTSSVDIDTPVADGFIKSFEEPTPYFGAEVMDEAPESDFFETEEYQNFPMITYSHNKTINFREWLSVNVKRFSKEIIAVLAATQFNIARLSSNNQPTAMLDTTRIIQMLSEKKLSVVSLSHELIMPRDQVQTSSLFAPSGAYLTWVQMLGEESHDN